MKADKELVASGLVCVNLFKNEWSKNLSLSRSICGFKLAWRIGGGLSLFPRITALLPEEVNAFRCKKAPIFESYRICLALALTQNNLQVIREDEK